MNVTWVAMAIKNMPPVRSPAACGAAQQYRRPTVRRIDDPALDVPQSPRIVFEPAPAGNAGRRATAVRHIQSASKKGVVRRL